MTEKFSLEQIRKFWADQAIQHGQSVSASWSDCFAIEMEVREILKYLDDGDRVLNVGCANGFTTVQFASQKKIEIHGIDYVHEMIEQARMRLKSLTEKLPGKVDFREGDLLNLGEQDDTYEKVISIRVLINMENWQTQLDSLKECLRVLKPGGLLLLSESTLQGWKKMNVFRNEWGLPDIPMPPFNRYLDEELVVQSVSDRLELIDLINFSSTYYVGTRVLKPLLAATTNGNVDAADPAMEWNRWFSMLPSVGDYGTQKLFLFRKK